MPLHRQQLKNQDLTQALSKEMEQASEALDFERAAQLRDQIQALRSFQISEAYQEAFGYEKMTAELRARIFGLNAAKVYGIDTAEVLQRAAGDAVGLRRADYRNDPDPHFLTYGPKTRRAYLARLKACGGSLV